MKNELINTVIQGDCLEVLRTLPDEYVNMCVTSPPYYGLRDYGVSGQIGLEETPEQYVNKLVEMFREVKRVLKDDGTLWLNLGDSYASNGGGQVEQTVRGNKNYVNSGQLGIDGKGSSRKPKYGYKSKDLIGIPWMVAFALRADGWYLRQDIIWNKPNPMPESVTDRCTKSHEYIFLLSKSQRYYFNHKAIKEESSVESAKRMLRGVSENHKNINGAPGQKPHTLAKARPRKFGAIKQEGTNRGDIGNTFVDTGYRNKRSVWTVTTKPFKGAHFATFPQDLIKPCILAGCPENGIVLDPFMGAGTTAIVSRKLSRNYIGTELNPEYIKIIDERIQKEIGLLI